MTTANELDQIAADLERCGLHDAVDPGEQLLVRRLADAAVAAGATGAALDALLDAGIPSVVRERAAVRLVAAIRTVGRDAAAGRRALATA